MKEYLKKFRPTFFESVIWGLCALTIGNGLYDIARSKKSEVSFTDPVKVSREIHKPYHDSFTAEAYYYDGNWAPRFVAFYETPIKDKSKPNAVVASSMDDGIYDIVRIPPEIGGRRNKCAVCHGTERDYKTDL